MAIFVVNQVQVETPRQKANERVTRIIRYPLHLINGKLRSTRMVKLFQNELTTEEI